MDYAAKESVPAFPKFVLDIGLAFKTTRKDKLVGLCRTLFFLERTKALHMPNSLIFTFLLLGHTICICTGQFYQASPHVSNFLTDFCHVDCRVEGFFFLR